MGQGTRQDERAPLALKSGYVKPDELSLAQRLRCSLAHAERLAFLDEHGRRRGTWGHLLEQDESVVLADMAAFPIEAMAGEVEAALSGLSSAEPLAYLSKLVRPVNRWYTTLLRARSPHASMFVVQSLAAEIQGRLGKSVNACRTSYGAVFVRAMANLQEVLHPHWGLALTSSPPPSSLEEDREAPAPEEVLRQALLNFTQALKSLRRLAAERLDASLATRTHDPAMGLLLAFLQLQQETFEPLNQFNERFTQFYYEDVLRMRPREGVADQVHLVFEAEPRFEGEVRVPPGAEFRGERKGDGNSVSFSADQGLLVSRVRVASLCQAHLERDALVSPECELGFPARTKAGRVPILPPEAIEVPRAPWWSLFGGPGGKSDADNFDACLGFAISSSLFELHEGERDIRVKLVLCHPAERDPVLLSLLKRPRAERDDSWEKQVFLRYQALDASAHPSQTSSPDQAEDPPPLPHGARSRDGEQYLRFLVWRCLACNAQGSLCERVGILFSAWLVAGSEDLLEEDLAALRAHCRTVLVRTDTSPVDVDDPLYLIYGDGPADRRLIFDRIFRSIFGVRVSVATGWLELEDVYLQLPLQSEGALGTSLLLSVHLGSEHPALCAAVPAIHGAAWPSQPVLQFELKSRTPVFGYGFLEKLEWKEAALSVAVRGLRDLVIHNQLGRLDPSKPFQPFGPLPKVGSYMLLGGSELATKPLGALRLNVEWAGLPPSEGGFRERYRGYPGSWDMKEFRARPSVLCDGQWRAGQDAPISLFSTQPEDRRLDSTIKIAFNSKDVRRYHRAERERSHGLPLQYDVHRRSGFFRLELVGPELAFGHEVYPRLVTEVLTENARFKRRKPLPHEPYTPILERVSVDYEADLTLQLKADGARVDDIDAVDRSPDGVFHLHPFGIERIFPARVMQRRFVVPRLEHDGNLFIGLEGTELPGSLSLFFHLRKETACEEWVEHPGANQWAVWAAKGWTPLAQQDVLSDTTLGFRRSGIVSLVLPKEASSGCPSLREGLFWLRLSAGRGFAAFAGLHGVYANGVSATRTKPLAPGESREPVPSGTIDVPLKSLPGVRRVLQVGPSFGLRGAETLEQMRTRVGERLRHKGRASTAWDIERLLLGAYPELFMAKCFPHHAPPRGPNGAGQGAPDAQKAPRGAVMPGSVLVVVVPNPMGAGLSDNAEAPRLDTATLSRMTDYIRGVTSPAVRITLRNASFERIQARCAVRLAKGSHPGTSLRLVNQAIVGFLSPWHEGGYGPSFDWEVRSEDLEARVRALSCVEAVGQVSLLHIVEDDQGRHHLEDTARKRSLASSSSKGGSVRVIPSFPWSLLLPTPRHLIDLVEDMSSVGPKKTGIGRLEVGGTFIMSKGANAQ